MYKKDSSVKVVIDTMMAMYGSCEDEANEGARLLKSLENKDIDYSKYKLSYKKLREILVESRLFTPNFGDVDEIFGLTLYQRSKTNHLKNLFRKV